MPTISPDIVEMMEKYQFCEKEQKTNAIRSIVEKIMEKSEMKSKKRKVSKKTEKEQKEDLELEKELSNMNVPELQFHPEFVVTDKIPPEIKDLIELYQITKKGWTSFETKVIHKSVEILREKMKNQIKKNLDKKKEGKKHTFAHNFIMEECSSDLICFVFDVSSSDYFKQIITSPPTGGTNWGRIKKKISGSCVIANQIFNHFNQLNGSVFKTINTLRLNLGGATKELVNDLNTAGFTQPMDAVHDTLKQNFDLEGHNDKTIVLPNIKSIQQGAFITSSDNCEVGTSSVIPFGKTNTQLGKEIQKSLKKDGRNDEHKKSSNLGCHDLGLCWTSMAITIAPEETINFQLCKQKAKPKSLEITCYRPRLQELSKTFGLIEYMIELLNSKGNLMDYKDQNSVFRKNITWVHSMYHGPDSTENDNAKIQAKFMKTIKDSIKRLKTANPAINSDQIEDNYIKSFDQKGFSCCWKLISKGMMKGYAVPGPFHTEYHVLSAISKIFFEPFLKDVSLMLDVKSDWYEFPIEKAKVVRKIVHVAHYYALKKLALWCCEEKGVQELSVDELMSHYEELLLKINYEASVVEKDDENNKEEKKKLEIIIQRSKEILQNNKPVIVQMLKDKKSHISGTKPLLVSRLLLAEDCPKLDPSKWNFVGFERLVHGLSTPVVQTLLHLIGHVVCPKGDAADLKKTLLSMRMKDNTPEDLKNKLSLYVFFKNFSLPAVLMHYAIRCADFDCWIISLKLSLKLWEITGKDKYWFITTRHLFDLENTFSDFHLNVYKQCWVTKCSTTKTNVGLDEKNEFINAFLKRNMHSISLEKLDFLANNYNFLEDLVAVWEKWFKTRSNKEERKSTNIDNANLDLIEDGEINIKIPGPLLQNYNNPVKFERLLDEMSKIVEEYGWEMDLTNVEDKFYA